MDYQIGKIEKVCLQSSSKYHVLITSHHVGLPQIRKFSSRLDLVLSQEKLTL